MKVLLFNGSPRANGCTFTALSVMARELETENVDTEIIQTGNKPVRDCIGCRACVGKGKCVFDDDPVNEWTERAKSADGFVFGTPVYYAHPSGRILSLMDRMFYSAGDAFAQKPGAVIASARRAGTTASLDAISKHLSICQMPIVTSTYWNMVHGNAPEQVLEDKEGINTVKNLARNMAWLLKCIDAGKSAGVTAPENDRSIRTNFIR